MNSVVATSASSTMFFFENLENGPILVSLFLKTWLYQCSHPRAVLDADVQTSADVCRKRHLFADARLQPSAANTALECAPLYFFFLNI